MAAHQLLAPSAPPERRLQAIHLDLAQDFERGYERKIVEHPSVAIEYIAPPDTGIESARPARCESHGECARCQQRFDQIVTVGRKLRPENRDPLRYQIHGGGKKRDAAMFEKRLYILGH